jgi:hypothetical protein
MRERDETRERFLTAIAEKINVDAVAEVHLFLAIKQGGTESGVAVVAVQEEPLLTGGAAAAENRPAARSAAAENRLARSASAENRLAVYTAKYRLTLKGADRGKWDFDIHAEADAPLVTVDKVVRGVQRRSGDAEDPEKMSGDEFRASLPPRQPAEGHPS